MVYIRPTLYICARVPATRGGWGCAPFWGAPPPGKGGAPPPVEVVWVVVLCPPPWGEVGGGWVVLPPLPLWMWVGGWWSGALHPAGVGWVVVVAGWVVGGGWCG